MKRILILTIVLSALASCTQAEKINVVPFPNDVQLNDGYFKAAGTDIYYVDGIDDSSVNLISQFAEQLSYVSGKQSELKKGPSETGIVFLYDSAMQSEAYALDVTKETVKVTASGLRGFNYAIQTIRQLLPVEIYGNLPVSGAKWRIPCLSINDAPRFAYRGLHLDEARHFFGMEEVKRYIDIMEVHKLNTLHWHLTDDQGWRIEIKKYPELTQIGSVRSGTCIKGDGNTNDGVPYGKGMWYTQDQIREIVRYAAAKGIDIVPEIDLPGHMLAALAAYPELGCKGGPYDVWHRWGVSEDVLCAGNDKIYPFLKDILAEVCELFPYEYIHIGGDECPKNSWKSCPKCQAKIKKLRIKGDKTYSAEHYLQSYVMAEMENFLATKDKKVIGWDEILEGNPSKSATIMSWRGEKGGIKAAGLGHNVIMTPNTYYYLDYYQTTDIENEPYGIGGYLPVKKCYSYEPYPESMSDSDRKHIIGVQANLWTEYIATPEHLEYMLLPRLAALAEVQWCNADRKDWDRFHDSADEVCAIYKEMGYNYATHLFNINGEAVYNKDRNAVVVTLSTQGDAPIYYTVDGSDPDCKSCLYTGPVEITNTCVFKAAVFRKDMDKRVFTYEIVFHKAVGKPISVCGNTKIGNCLVDALRGPAVHKRPEWLDSTAKPMDVVLDMGGSTPYSSVCVGAIINKPKRVLNPTYLSVSVSDDAVNYTELVREDYVVEGQHDPNGIKEYRVAFPETSARYLKVSIGCLPRVPQWHHYNGRTAIIQIDEIIVE